MIEPETLQDIPSNVDFSANYILDDACPRSELGLGVSSIELSVGHQRQKDIDLDGKVHAAGIQLGAPPITDTKGGVPAAAPLAPPSTRTKPEVSRVLQKQTSDDATDAKAIELIAQNCKAAFEKGLWSSPDPLNSNNVAFWLLKYKDHVLHDFKESKLTAEEQLKYNHYGINFCFFRDVAGKANQPISVQLMLSLQPL